MGDNVHDMILLGTALEFTSSARWKWWQALAISRRRPCSPIWCGEII
jgi:hypothetical protein